jgi:secondary thiamine-phosphate synthase enzyme
MSMMFWGPERFTLDTERPFQLVDITDRIDDLLAGSGIEAGSAQAFCPHTSCGLAVTELEDGLHADLEAVLEELAPVGRAWVHDDLVRRWQNLEVEERLNGWSHIRGLLATQPSAVLPLARGRLALGRWQRLFLVELDGSRTRTLEVQAWGRPA